MEITKSKAARRASDAEEKLVKRESAEIPCILTSDYDLTI
jgi:hypothetical protein